MPFSWEKVIPHKPQMLEAARGWYDKWIRGERVHTSANDGADRSEPVSDGMEPISAYAEPVSIEDVVEVKEATRDVASRLDALEFAGMAQAETVKNLTEQNQDFSTRMADLQQSLAQLDQSMHEARADADGHRTSLQSMEMQMQRLSADISKLSSRVNTAIWVAVVGVVGSIVALSLTFMR